eukprot:1390966-Amorphochlora_amoeboformis.AAC.1
MTRRDFTPGHAPKHHFRAKFGEWQRPSCGLTRYQMTRRDFTPGRAPNNRVTRDQMTRRDVTPGHAPNHHFRAKFGEC